MATPLVDISHGGQMKPLTILTKGYCSQDEIRSNVITNIKRDVLRFMDLPLLVKRDDPLAIVGGGPSTNANIEKIGGFKQVMVCGSAHDHLIRKGITPTFAIAVDPQESQADYYNHPCENTSYILASQCHPTVFDKLQGHKIAMWNFRGQLDDEEKYFNDEPLINWGCMIGVHSIQLALYLGFQELHFFGFDCSYVGEEHHAYDVGEKFHNEIADRKIEFSVNDKKIFSTMALISQVEHLYDVFASVDGNFIKGIVYGDGLWANNIAQSIKSTPEMSNWLSAPDVE